MKILLRWFCSKTVRKAVALRSHVRRQLAAQRDLLPTQAKEEVQKALDRIKDAIRTGQSTGLIKQLMSELESAAEKNLRAYPFPRIRENVEVLLVAITVAMGIRTFFLQPFKIPTGSMQPTLWGVTSFNVIDRPEVTFPKGLSRFRDWLRGTNYVHLVAKTDGYLEAIEAPWPPVILSIYQRIMIGGKWHYIWFPPDYGAPPFGTLPARANLKPGMYFRKGQDVVKLIVKKGDYLFVDRFTYNFRRPKRGEIIVFETWGFNESLRAAYRVPPDQFYIKRLVGLSGETIRIGADNHVYVNGNRLDASVPHFEFIYSFKTNAPENDYFGHIPLGLLSTPTAMYQIPPDSYFVLGDNTRNSLDSRFLGAIPRTCVIGKAFFVYWPISDRFGLGYR